jgi:hypothetical protein
MSVFLKIKWSNLRKFSGQKGTKLIGYSQKRFIFTTAQSLETWSYTSTPQNFFMT